MNTKILTSFRFFAAYVVVVFHYGQDTDFAALAKGALTAGPQMVTFFYVLSGFVLTFAYLRREGFSLSDYWAARVARIVPVYFLALFFSYLFFYSPTHPMNNIKGLLLNMTFLQSWVSPYPLSLNMPAWSLSVEVFFYICFPLILIFLKTTKPKALSVFASAMVLYLLTQLVLINLVNSDFYQGYPSASHDMIYYFPLSHLCSFVLGVAGGYLAMQTKVCDYFHNKLFWTAGSFAAIVIVFYCLNNNVILGRIGGLSTAPGASFLAPLFLVLIFFSVNTKNLLASFFCLRPLIVLGEASYGLYILQVPAYKLYLKFALPYFASYAPFDKNTLFYTYSFCLITLSVVVYYFFELPAKRVLLQGWKYLKCRKDKQLLTKRAALSTNQ